MALNETQQINKLISDSHYVLVVFNSASDIDSISSVLAINNLITGKNKQIDMVCPDFTYNKNLRFLKNVDKIKPSILHSQKFTIKIDVANTDIDSLSYDIKDDLLSIHLNPKKGIMTKERLKTAQSAFKYDLIITINTPDLNSLGEMFNTNTDLFYKLPIINIDHNPANENYGQINIVEVESTSSCEILYKIFEQIEPLEIVDETATALLCGIINKTRSFKAGNITPHTLNIASQLMKKGADRKKIIKHLYYHRSINSLKLWGKALNHLQSDPGKNLVWTTLTRDDFARSGANEEDLNEIVDELLINSPSAEVIVLLFEKNGTTGVFGTVITTVIDARHLVDKYNANGTKRKINFYIKNKNLAQVEKELVEEIKNKIVL